MSGGSDRVLKFPYRGAPQTVGVIKKAALDSQRDLSVRNLAESICSGLPSKCYVGEYLALYNAVQHMTRYMRDPRTVELVRAPYVIARQMAAGQVPNLDCDDLTALLSALVLSVGGQVRIVTVAFRNMVHNGQRQYSHVFAEARDPKSGRWIVLDPVASHKTSEMLGRVVAAKIWPVA